MRLNLHRVYQDRYWFAWYPVKSLDGKYIMWLENVWKCPRSKTVYRAVNKSKTFYDGCYVRLMKNWFGYDAGTVMLVGDKQSHIHPRVSLLEVDGNPDIFELLER